MTVLIRPLPVSAGRAPARQRATRLLRAARTGLLGLLVSVVLVLPFPAAGALPPALSGRVPDAGPEDLAALASISAGPAAGEDPTPGTALTPGHGAALTPRPPLPDAGEGERAASSVRSSPSPAHRERGRGGEGSPGTGSLLARSPAGAQADQDDPLTTLERLLATPRPLRDPVALAGLLAGTEIPWVATEPFAGPLQVGRRDTFFVLDQTDNTYQPRPAVLRLVSEHAYWYVQDGENVRDEDLAAAASQFDRATVPTIRRVFGSEWVPGIDGDPRVTIFLGSAPGVSAYFSSWDEYPRSVYRYSNEREIIHVNVGSTRPGSSSFNGTLAHEFQHMVHWHQNRSTDTWLDEGFAELASALAVAGRGPGTGGLQRQPDVQLTTWSQNQTGLHYQASYLFAQYLAERFGEAAIGGILAEPGRPPESITAYLSRAGHGLTFEDVFEDWIVANLLDDPAVGDGRYGYAGIDHTVSATRELRVGAGPLDEQVSQFGAEYVELRGDGGAAELTFEGAATVRLVDAEPTSGQALWWSNRADSLDATLTRRFDLSEVASATLRFRLWYDTERDFDFVYVLASRDGGASWEVLRGAAAEDENPTGNAIGPGYSGKSGISNGQSGQPSWIAETVDLSPYAGGDVLVRFEYVTDQGFNLRGALLDDVEIPEIGFRDDAEADAGWQAEGFLRSDNTISQTWSLQLVEQRRDGSTRVRPLRADATGRVVERLAGLGGDLERAVLVIGGLAPRTLEDAPFRVELRPAP